MTPGADDPVLSLHAAEPLDLLIAGLGPGGCAAALAAGQEGLRTLAVDARGPDPQRAQLVLIRPGARAALHSLGLPDITDGRRTTTIRHVETRLRAAMQAAATQSETGATPLQVQWHTSIAALDVGTDHVLVTLRDEASGQLRQVAARHVVDASGGRLEGLGRPARERAGPNHWVLIAEYATPPWWGPGLVGVRDAQRHDMYLLFPTWHRETVIAYFDAHPNRAVNTETLAQCFDEMAQRLDLGPPVHPVVSVDVMQRRLMRASQDRVLPIGDSVGTVDVLLGAGMSTAIEDGAEVGRVVAEAQRATSSRAEMAITRRASARILARHRSSMRQGRLLLWARPLVEWVWPKAPLPDIDRSIPGPPPLLWPAVRFVYGRRPPQTT
jgi:2-polyprenyl-6-methoxyphenol hydroxylase-like FAD-dependent oxidoreductase